MKIIPIYSFLFKRSLKIIALIILVNIIVPPLKIGYTITASIVESAYIKKYAVPKLGILIIIPII